MIRVKGLLLGVMVWFALAGVAHGQAENLPVEHPGIPDATWVSIYFDTFDPVARAAGLTPLRTKNLPSGSKEVRVWTGLAIGEPKRMYRFVIQEDSVGGELILHWGTDSDRDHDLMLHSLDGACRDFTRQFGAGICRAVFDEEPSWQNRYQQAKNAGLWTLPDPSALPDDSTMVWDGWIMTVELRDGDHYRTYQYNNPRARKWPEADSALQVARSIRPIAGAMKSPDVRRTYHGVTTGKYREAFYLCESDSVWGFRASLSDLAEEAEIALPDPGPHGYEVKVIGEATPEWLAQEWESKFTRELQAFVLESVQSASKKQCTSPSPE